MFTRFKTLSVIFFFFLSFLIITLVWGENGILERNQLAIKAEGKENEAREMEARIALLRERSATESEESGSGYRLVASFPEEGKSYSVEKTNRKDDVLEKDYEGLGISKCLLWATVPTILLALIEFFFIPWAVKRKIRKDSDGSDN